MRLRLVLLLCLTPTAAARGADRPNFVWLLSEDNSVHYLKLFDEHGAETPRIAELAEHGLLFSHAFSNSPVCSVARTTLITGCYGPRIGTQYHRRSTLVPLPDGLRMFPAYLREAGYYTTNNRKKDYNALEGEGVWDASSNRAHWRGRQSGQPFFHMQSFAVTHESSLHFSQQAMSSQPTETDPESVFVAPIHPDTPTFRYTYARYHDRIREMDGQIGKVVDQLRADGLLEDTFVFYFGDHGGVLPGSKGYAYDRGLHVPLVVRVPDNFKHLVDADFGQKMPGFVSFIDFGPTLLHLAGLPTPDQVDGRPFLGAGVTKTQLEARDEAFGYADRFDEKYDLVRTLRKGRFEYVRSYQPFNFDGLQNNYRYRCLAYQEWRRLDRAGKLDAAQAQFFRPRPAEALYDLEADPYETRNLADDPQHAETLADLRGRLRKRVSEMPDLSLLPESVLARRAFENPSDYGRRRQAEIARLVEVADLALAPWPEARGGVAAALASENPGQRYWGLIVCSAHGKAASSFVETARLLAADDSEPLVRVRAAEFLGLIGAEPPQATLLDVLSKSADGVESCLTLNTLVLLRDGEPGYEFDVDPQKIPAAARQYDGVKRRLEYLQK